MAFKICQMLFKWEKKKKNVGKLKEGLKNPPAGFGIVTAVFLSNLKF